MPKGIKKTTVLQRNVPKHVTKQIGAIVAKWAYFEYRLSMAIWKLTGVDDAIGRLAVADPRATDKLEIIRSLLHLRGIDIKETEFRKLHKSVDELREKRDMLAHGVWIYDEGWKLLNFKGNLPDQTIPKLRKKRRLMPESFLATSTGFAIILQSLEKAIDAADQLNALASTPAKLHQQ